MKHLDEGTLQALADGELREPAEQEAQRHIAGCAICQESYREVRAGAAIFSSAVRLLDRPAPAAALRPPPSMAPRRARWNGVALSKAAAVLLMVAAAASATIPGSPVRDWLAGRVEAPEPPVAVREELRTEAAPAVMAAPAEAGVSVTPSDGAVRIVLSEVAPELTVRATLSDVPRAGVHATGEAANARFQTSAGTIQVIGGGPGELRIEIPRLAEQATVVVEGRTYLTKEGDRLHLTGRPADGGADEVIFQVGQ